MVVLNTIKTSNKKQEYYFHSPTNNQKILIVIVSVSSLKDIWFTCTPALVEANFTQLQHFSALKSFTVPKMFISFPKQIYCSQFEFENSNVRVIAASVNCACFTTKWKQNYCVAVI